LLRLLWRQALGGWSVIRVFVVAEVRLYEEGLARILRDDGRFDVVGTAQGVGSGLERIRGLADPPHVVLLDIALPDGVGALEAFAAELPDAGVVALSVSEDEDAVLSWAEAGAAGFVSRDASLDDLMTTIESVARGETICSPRITATLLRRVAALGRDARLAPRAQLTARELEVATLFDEGISNKEIAARLRIQLPTVKNHVHNILEKLDVSSRGEAAAVLRGAHATPWRNAPRSGP
jgi:two-component system nitrate/nitrite response regulator NarL